MAKSNRHANAAAPDAAKSRTASPSGRRRPASARTSAIRGLT